MRIPRALLTIVALITLVLIACGGDGDSEPAATATLPPPTVTATPAIQIDVPGRPNAFADYAGVVGIYLTLAGEAVLGEPCLEELIAEWAMADFDLPLTPEERCLTGNTDSDADDEVVVLFTVESEDGFGLLSNVVVFDSTADGYVAVFQSSSPDQFPQVFPGNIVVAEDVTGDGNGDLVYTTNTCGANTCTLAVHVVTGDGGEYVGLTPEEGLLMETADLTLEEGVGDGSKLIVLHGGTFSSVGAGPQRTRTEVYGWDGESFAMLETTYELTDLLYFHILDADLIFNAGNVAIAGQMYRTLLEDESLTETGFQENERAELSAYALFRQALAILATDSDGQEALDLLAQARNDYPDAVNTGLAIALEDAHEIGVPAGCLAVREHIEANLDDFQAVWEYGYTNPAFDAERICPF